LIGSDSLRNRFRNRSLCAIARHESKLYEEQIWQITVKQSLSKIIRAGAILSLHNVEIALT
jgi:hypothetical protein